MDHTSENALLITVRSVQPSQAEHLDSSTFLFFIDLLLDVLHCGSSGTIQV